MSLTWRLLTYLIYFQNQKFNINLSKMNNLKEIFYFKTSNFKENNEQQQAKKLKTSNNMQILCDNNRYHWKDDNKSSTRSVCSKKAKEGCSGSLTVKRDDPKSVVRHTPHNPLNNLFPIY